MSSSAAAGAGGGDNASGPLRFFSGESEDSQEYKRWKVWVMNKLLTLDKLPKAAKGAYVYTLLAGKALESVEHLDPSEYQKEGGDQVLLALLDSVFLGRTRRMRWARPWAWSLDFDHPMANL